MNYKQLKATGNSVSNYNYEYVENTNERTFASTYYFLIDTAFYLITIYRIVYLQRSRCIYQLFQKAIFIKANIIRALISIIRLGIKFIY